MNGGANNPRNNDRTARKRPGRGQATRDALVRSALELIDEIGFEALTIRAVAQRAGVAPMSLYTHFAAKEELLEAMYLEAARQLCRDNGAVTWQAELSAFSHRVRDQFLAHPNWLKLFTRPKMRTPISHHERFLQLMLDAGFSLELAHEALLQARLMALGFTLVELMFRCPDGDSTLEQRWHALRQQAEEAEFSESYPLTVAAVRKLPRLDLTERFERAIQIAISGLETLCRRPSIAEAHQFQ
jgi:TetR/AcrR family tetracycline transcriptional repressor